MCTHTCSYVHVYSYEYGNGYRDIDESGLTFKCERVYVCTRIYACIRMCTHVNEHSHIHTDACAHIYKYTYV